MTPNWLDTLVPFFAISLVAAGALAALLRGPGLHALGGICMLSWAGLLLLSDLAHRAAKADAILAAALLAVGVAAQAVVGIRLFAAQDPETEPTELES